MATTAPIERRARVLHGDCLTVLAGLAADSVDAVVTDPPYHLTDIAWHGRAPHGEPRTAAQKEYRRTAARGFMGKSWDGGWLAFDPATWDAIGRVLKPGGHLLAFGGTRTSHRMVCAIEDAGFEVRDCLMWLYGSGFPKSLDVSKAIDKAAGAERDVIGEKLSPDGVPYSARKKTFQTAGSHDGYKRPSDSCPRTELTARRWQGWGTALKPAYEPIVLARKPLVGTVAQNVQTYGTGAINVDGCRIPADGRPHIEKTGERSPGISFDTLHSRAIGRTLGRWPANVLHDGSEEVVALFPQTQAASSSMRGLAGRHDAGDQSNQRIKPYTNSVRGHDDNGGSAARFFYTAKASRRERGEGNIHPTVKPLALMRYLCKLVTPPDGLILDPFAGSGSTGVAAVREGFRFLGIEQDDASMKTADRRTIETEFLPLERFLLDEGDE